MRASTASKNAPTAQLQIDTDIHPELINSRSPLPRAIPLPAIDKRIDSRSFNH